MCIFVQFVKLHSYSSRVSLKVKCGPRKVLEKSFKNGCNFLFEPSAGETKLIQESMSHLSSLFLVEILSSFCLTLHTLLVSKKYTKEKN